MNPRLEKIKSDNEVLNHNNPALKEEIDWLIKQAEANERIKEEIKGKWSTEKVSVNRLNQIFDK